MPAGRPVKYTPEELEAKFIDYFESTPFEEWTITGMCLHCDATKDLLCDYEKRPEFSYLVKNAKMKVEHSYEKSLKQGTSNAAGTIFALKQFGWKDKQDVVHTGEGGGPIKHVAEVIFVEPKDQS